MAINEFDDPQKLGLAELGLKVLVCILAAIISYLIYGATLYWFAKAFPEGDQAAPDFVTRYVYKFLRLEWLVFLMALELHTRTVDRAIRFGPINAKVTVVSLAWPLLLAALLSLSLSAAFWGTYVSTPWWLLPFIAQIGVWIVWETMIAAYFKYVPKTPTGAEIKRSF